MSEDLNQVMRIRREKLDLLQAKGILPFAYRFDRTHSTQDAASTFKEAEESGEVEEGGHGPSVRVGGRLKSFRGHGKSAFGHIEDGSGAIQVYFRKDVLGDESFQNVLELLDLGDWLGVEGPLFRTRTGEVTVRAESWTFLSKSLRPLPMGKTEEDAETGERVTMKISSTPGAYSTCTPSANSFSLSADRVRG